MLRISALMTRAGRLRSFFSLWKSTSDMWLPGNRRWCQMGSTAQRADLHSRLRSSQVMIEKMNHYPEGRERTIHTRNSHQSLDRRFPVIHSGREHGQHWNVIRLIILPRETVSGMGFIDCPLRRAKSLEPFLPDTTKTEQRFSSNRRKIDPGV